MVCGMHKTTVVLVALLTASCSGSSSPLAPTPPPRVPVTPVPIVTPTPTPAFPPADARFNQTFWDQFVHGSWEHPGSLDAFSRLPAAPRLYLKTVDEAGLPIDAATLDIIAAALTGVAPTWTGGAFGLAGVERGTSTKEGLGGWITVKWPNPSLGAVCGRSTIGEDGGWIALNYRRQDASCACQGSQMTAATARHELGHAFGYRHTDGPDDLMSVVNPTRPCDQVPSAREAYHAGVAYAAAPGSLQVLGSRALRMPSTSVED